MARDQSFRIRRKSAESGSLIGCSARYRRRLVWSKSVRMRSSERRIELHLKRRSFAYVMHRRAPAERD